MYMYMYMHRYTFDKTAESSFLHFNFYVKLCDTCIILVTTCTSFWLVEFIIMLYNAGHVSVLKWLNAKGDISVMDRLGGTPLHDAAEHGQFEVSIDG